MTDQRRHEHNTYAWRFTQALEFPVRDPLRLLACAVIARWVEDVQRAPHEPIGIEWAALAEVPDAWLLEVGTAA